MKKLWSNPVILAVAIVLILSGPTMALQLPRPDSDQLVSAALDYNYARELAQCNPPEAVRLLANAEESIKKFIPATQSAADTAEALKSNVVYLQISVSSSQTERENSKSEIEKLLQQHRFLSALTLIDLERAKTPACAHPFPNWAEQAHREHFEATQMLAAAKELIDTQPRQAIAIATAVERRDAELPEAETVRIRAEVVEKSYGHATLRKFVKTAVFAGLVGGGMYLGYRGFLNWEARHPIPATH